MKKTLPPIHPNVGVQENYRKRLDALVDAMHRSLTYWIVAAYRKNPPATMALDASSSRILMALMRRLAKYWNKKFKEASLDIAQYFATETAKRVDSRLQNALKDSGFAIKFKITETQNEVLQSTIAENVSLITNISEKHMNEIYGMVMRSVQVGGDVGGLKKQLEDRYMMTKRRASLIARDQNSKATSALTRIRQQESGITQAKWLHSHGGREPRPTHVAMDTHVYDVSKGMWDKDAHGKGKGDWVWPGQLINCRCTSRSLIPELAEFYK